MAIVVHVKEKKMRFKDVDQDESIGIANNEATGSVTGARNDVKAASDMLRLPECELWIFEQTCTATQEMC